MSHDTNTQKQKISVSTAFKIITCKPLDVSLKKNGNKKTEHPTTEK